MNITAAGTSHTEKMQSLVGLAYLRFRAYRSWARGRRLLGSREQSLSSGETLLEEL